MAITKTAAATSAHIKCVLSDPDFIQEHEALRHKKNYREHPENFLKQYGLTIDDFDTHDNALAYLMNPDKLFSAGYLEYNPDRHEFTASFSEDIKKAQFQELWLLITKNKNRLEMAGTKFKPPQLPELLYAIFKARKNNMTFKKIFADYQDGYIQQHKVKNTRQYKSEDDLEKYYRTYYHIET